MNIFNLRRRIRVRVRRRYKEEAHPVPMSFDMQGLGGRWMKKSRGFTGSEGEGLEKVELKTVGDPLDETGVKVNESSHHLRTREVN